MLELNVFFSIGSLLCIRQNVRLFMAVYIILLMSIISSDAKSNFSISRILVFHKERCFEKDFKKKSRIVNKR